MGAGINNKDLRKAFGYLFRSSSLRWPRRVLIVPVVLVCVFGCVRWMVDFPMDKLRTDTVASLSFYDSSGKLLRQEMSRGGYRETWVSLEDISPHLINATLASEDSGFYGHWGVDWLAMVRACWLNLKNGTFAYGGSTITMQLVRLTTGTSRTIPGKLHQMFLAMDLEDQLSKEKILEYYFNRVYYGNGVWGAQQAANFYFGKSAGELSVGEAATLAVIPRGPSRYDPFRHWQRCLERRVRILELMAKYDYLNQEALELAKRTPITMRRLGTDFLAPHLVQFAKERLPEKFRNGARVTTTLDLSLQERLERVLATHVNKLAWRNLTQAALVVIRNRDGAVLAMVGSVDYGDYINNGAYNGVTARLRPGSTLKPFVYGAAMEMGDTAATIAYDVVLPNDAHQFYTKDVRSHGFARYRESLAGSYNLSAVHVLQRVGKQTVLKKMRDAGLLTLDRPDDKYDWGLAIGHADVRLLDLTGAFSVFGRGGRPISPYVIAEAVNSEGERWSESSSEGKRVFSEEIAYIIFDMLSDPDARRPMFGNRVPMNLPFKVALKTGTTKAYTDLWALGTTAEYTVGVWAGNFNGEPTHQVKSVHGATPLMRAAYTAIAAMYGPPNSAVPPDGIVKEAVCPVSGMAAGPLCEHRKQELFVKGTAPSKTCDWHQKACDKIVVVYPKELKGWAAAMDPYKEPECFVSSPHGSPRIVSPVEGSQFLLEPHRPARLQRPPLKAFPSDALVSWQINGLPAKSWIPTPGTHTVEAFFEHGTEKVSITYVE